MPPLRERRDDIPLLLDHFLAKLTQSKGKRILGFTPETLAILGAHRYEGNIRELENLVERAYALTDAETYITPDLLPDSLSGTVGERVTTNGTLRAAVERFEEQLIRDELAKNASNQTRTAVELGMSRRALIDKLQKYKIR